MASWPTTLPQTPLTEGYKEAPQDTRLISSVDAGHRKIRNRFTAASFAISETYWFTEAEFLIFKDFYENTLNNGSLDFTKMNPISETSRLYRFESVYDLNQISYPFFKVVIKLEMLP